MVLGRGERSGEAGTDSISRNVFNLPENGLFSWFMTTVRFFQNCKLLRSFFYAAVPIFDK